MRTWIKKKEDSWPVKQCEQHFWHKQHLHKILKYINHLSKASQRPQQQP